MFEIKEPILCFTNFSFQLICSASLLLSCPGYDDALKVLQSISTLSEDDPLLLVFPDYNNPDSIAYTIGGNYALPVG